MIALTINTAICFSLILLLWWIQCILDGSWSSVLVISWCTWLCRIEQVSLIRLAGHMMLPFRTSLVYLAFALHRPLSIIPHSLPSLFPRLYTFLLIALIIIILISIFILISFIFIKSTRSSVIHFTTRIMIGGVGCSNGTFLSPPPLAQIG